jgi:hypothetical protein
LRDGTTHIDAADVVARLEQAGATLLSLPGHSERIACHALAALPAPVATSDMDEALGWIVRIPQERVVLRRIVGARALVSPATGRHIYSWRRIAKAVGLDHKAVQRLHRQGIEIIVANLRAGKPARAA